MRHLLTALAVALSLGAISLTTAPVSAGVGAILPELVFPSAPVETPTRGCSDISGASTSCVRK